MWRLLATGGMPEFLCYWLHDPGNPSFGASLLWAGPVQKAAGLRGQVSPGAAAGLLVFGAGTQEIPGLVLTHWWQVGS